MLDSDSKFSRIRSFFWPIYRHELIKFVPMMFLFFLISFNYHLLRITKDALIITAPKSGAEVIPFLKVWAMLPTAIAMTFIFTKLASKFNRETFFYIIITAFLSYFAIFILFLYPYRETLYLNNLADLLEQYLSPGFRGFIAIIRYWILSIFYVIAESWSIIMVSLLLWGFANEVTKVSEAKRFYAFFGIGINSSGILAGQCGAYLSNHMQSTSSIYWITSLFGGKTPWDQTVLAFVGIIILCGVISIGIYRWLHLYIFKDHLLAPKKKENPQLKMSLKNSITYVAKSKYLIYIALIVLSYNLVINFTEVLWKSQVKALFPSPSDYTFYMSRITFFIGILATFTSYVISGNVIRGRGWKFAALISPTILVITGITFFYFLFLNQYFSNINALVTIMGMTPLALTVFFGSLQNCLSKACKYTLFDDTKEMAFIPLEKMSKLKGKAAIDGIGSRLGKSGSSFVLQLLLIFFTTPIACSPFIFVLVLTAISIWILAVHLLGKKFNELTSPSFTATYPKSEDPIATAQNLNSPNV